MNDWLGRLDTWDAGDATLDELSLGYPGFRAALTASIASASPRAAELVARFGVGWHQLNKFRDAVALGDRGLGDREGYGPGHVGSGCQRVGDEQGVGR